MGGYEQALRGQRSKGESDCPGCACGQTPDDLPGEHGETRNADRLQSRFQGWCYSHDPGSHSRRVHPVFQLSPSSGRGMDGTFNMFGCVMVSSANGDVVPRLRDASGDRDVHQDPHDPRFQVLYVLVHHFAQLFSLNHD